MQSLGPTSYYHPNSLNKTPFPLPGTLVNKESGARGPLVRDRRRPPVLHGTWNTQYTAVSSFWSQMSVETAAFLKSGVSLGNTQAVQLVGGTNYVSCNTAKRRVIRRKSMRLPPCPTQAEHVLELCMGLGEFLQRFSVSQRYTRRCPFCTMRRPVVQTP